MNTVNTVGNIAATRDDNVHAARRLRNTSPKKQPVEARGADGSDGLDGKRTTSTSGIANVLRAAVAVASDPTKPATMGDEKLLIAKKAEDNTKQEQYTSQRIKTAPASYQKLVYPDILIAITAFSRFASFPHMISPAS